MSSEMRAAWRYSLGAFIALRIGVSLLGLIGTGVVPERGVVDVPGWPDQPITAGLHNAVTSLERQDALWFLRIADTGYRDTDGSAAFFPGYPMMVRGVSFVLGDRPLAAAYVVSNLSFLLALVLLFDLTRREFSEEAARRTILYLCVFPTSFFLLAPYSESLFLLLAVVLFREARLRRVPAAVMAGIGAAFTRSIGVILAPALAAEVFQTWQEDRRAGHRGPHAALAFRLVAAAAIPLGLLAYLAYWNGRGATMAPLHYQAVNWQRAPSFPLTSLWIALRDAWRQGSYWLLDVLVVVPAIALAAGRAVRRRWGYTVYVWLGLVAPLCLVWHERTLMSMPRFVVVLFPLFWVLADLTMRRKLPHALVIAVGAAGLSLLTVLFAVNYFVF